MASLASVPRSGMKTAFVTLAGARSRDWLIALLNSLAVHEPGACLHVIPFDNDGLQLRDLEAAFAVRLWTPDCLAELDELGRHLGAGRCQPGYYRKFAAFLAPGDAIIY